MFFAMNVRLTRPRESTGTICHTLNELVRTTNLLKTSRNSPKQLLTRAVKP
jgi:hypothetical protein